MRNPYITGVKIPFDGEFLISRLDPGSPYDSVFQWYSVDSDDEAFSELRESLSKYSYHRNFWTVWPEKPESYHYGKTVTVRYEWKEGSETRLITLVIGNAGYIDIDGREYRVGYWGNAKSERLWEEIKEILAELKPIES